MVILLILKLLLTSCVKAMPCVLSIANIAINNVLWCGNWSLRIVINNCDYGFLGHASHLAGDSTVILLDCCHSCFYAASTSASVASRMALYKFDYYY